MVREEMCYFCFYYSYSLPKTAIYLRMSSPGCPQVLPGFRQQAIIFSVLAIKLFVITFI